MARRFLTGVSTKLFELLLRLRGVKTTPDTLARLEDDFFKEDLPDPFPAIDSEHVVTNPETTFKVVNTKSNPNVVILRDSMSEIEYEVELDLFDNVFAPSVPASATDLLKDK